jgi:hypothetical protein
MPTLVTPPAVECKINSPNLLSSIYHSDYSNVSSILILLMPMLRGRPTDFLAALQGFSTSLEALNEEIELQPIGLGLDGQPAGQVFNALNGVPKPFNLINSLNNFVKIGVSALNTYRPILQQYWKPGLLLIVVPVGISVIANSNYGAVSQPTSISSSPVTPTTTATSTTASPTVTLTPASYLLTTVEDTPLVVFQWFTKILPDKGLGEQIVRTGIPWQEYVTDLNPIQAAGISLIPFIDTVELDVYLDDLDFGVARDPRQVEPRAPTYSTLPNSPDWLKLISQKQGNDVNNNYFYDTTQGAGTKLYIIDTGYYSTLSSSRSVSSKKTGLQSDYILIAF